MEFVKLEAKKIPVHKHYSLVDKVVSHEGMSY